MALTLDDKRAIIASRLLNMRQAGDYDDMFDWEEEDIIPLFPQVEELLSVLRNLISIKIES